MSCNYCSSQPGSFRSSQIWIPLGTVRGPSAGIQDGKPRVRIGQSAITTNPVIDERILPCLVVCLSRRKTLLQVSHQRLHS
jgi:hypothetical protein